MARRGLILDRDGVVNHDTGYLFRIADCRFVDGIFEMCAAFAAKGYLIVIATNQSGIGRGYHTEAEFRELMDWMGDAFRCHGAPIAGVYHCPDHPTEGQGSYRRDTLRRKPGPGMLLEAAADLGLDLAASWTVGDQPRDIAAGRAAGVGTLVLFDPARPAVSRDGDVWAVPRLADVIDLLAKEG